MLKLCQLITAFWLDCRTVRAPGLTAMFAAPAATFPPSGKACAWGVSTSSARHPARAVEAWSERLLCTRVAGTQISGVPLSGNPNVRFIKIVLQK